MSRMQQMKYREGGSNIYNGLFTKIMNFMALHALDNGEIYTRNSEENRNFCRGECGSSNQEQLRKKEVKYMGSPVGSNLRDVGARLRSPGYTNYT